jgi:acetylornithine deacetylase/succinyl-diaminopimelate desuccinylase-like protein
LTFRTLCLASTFLFHAFYAVTACAETDKAANALARDIFEQLIEINTTDSVGNVTTAAQAMAKRLVDAGFSAADVQVLGDKPNKKNLVARLRGTGKHRPVLLLGHLDVVEARREDWTTDPFELVEKEGYFYARGALDMKSHDAIMVTTLIRLRKEGFRPDRDVILALTAGEESGVDNGIEWLLKHHRSLVDAEFVVNQDDTSVFLQNGKPQFYNLTASEKLYADFLMTTTNLGGHSSMPVPDNAIYQLTDGLTRLARFQFPFELNDITRGYYERMTTIETGQRAADMRAILQVPPDGAAIERLSRDTIDRSLVRTTCVATRLDAGHANNALPQRAQAIVNCRILPGHTPEEVRKTLVEVLADPGIRVQYLDKETPLDTAPDERAFAPPSLHPAMLRPLQKVVGDMWPGLQVVPYMSMGATDAVYTIAAGIPTYVVTGIAIERDDDRSHGQDERLGVQSFYRGVEFLYRYIKAVTKP